MLFLLLFILSIIGVVVTGLIFYSNLLIPQVGYRSSRRMKAKFKRFVFWGIIVTSVFFLFTYISAIVH